MREPAIRGKTYPAFCPILNIDVEWDQEQRFYFGDTARSRLTLYLADTATTLAQLESAAWQQQQANK